MNKRIITIRKSVGSLKIKLTQYLIKNYDLGHYYWVIEDTRGNIKSCGSSTGGVPKKIKEQDVLDIFDRWIDEISKPSLKDRTQVLSIRLSRKRGQSDSQ